MLVLLVIGNNQFFLSDAFSVEPIQNLNKRYLYHWLLSIQHKIYSLKQGGGIPHVYGKDLGKFKIPIPSLEIQQKIVEILDKFSYCITELQASLKLELELRTKQYEYYRDMLLSEEFLRKKTVELCGQKALVETKTLGEIGKIKMCKRILKEQTSLKGDVPFYKIGTFGKQADSFISKSLFLEYKEKYNYPKKKMKF